MRFYEFEAKRLLTKHGIPVIQGSLAQSAAEAEKLAGEIGNTVVLKAQVLSRKPEAVAPAETPSQARQVVEKLLQLDDGGRRPKGVLVEKKMASATQYSLAFTYDGAAKRPLMLASSLPGNIEEIAEKEPQRVSRRRFSALLPFSDYLAKELVAGLGVTGGDLTQLTGLVSRAAQLFLRYDLSHLEIYSLAKSDDGKFAVVDCHADMEVEARRRQKTTLDELGFAPGDTRPPREATQFEVDAAKIDSDDPRGIAGPVVEFDGNIGLVIGAGGGSLTTFDAIKKHGGRPANYAALGGNPSVRKAQRLTKLVLSKPGVDKIAVISNVVSNTRADLVARGVIKAVVEMGFKPADKILIFRVPGAWEADAAKILKKYGVEFCDRSVSISEAARRAVEKTRAAR
jgi:succinyl-CoA synthetase beta subunit/citryl-CoA synthetase large subunit